MARTTKSRVTARHSTASDVEESLLASSRPSALRDVVLPEPGKEQPMTLAAAAASAVDEDAPEAPAAARRNTWLVAAAALVLLGGGLVAFMALRGGADDGTRVAASGTSAERGAAVTSSLPSADEPPAEPSEPGAIAEQGDDNAADDNAADDNADEAANDEGAGQAGTSTDSKADGARASGSARTRDAADKSPARSSGDAKVAAKADTKKADDEPKKTADEPKKVDKPKAQDLDTLLDVAAGEEGKQKADVVKAEPERKVTDKTKLSRTDVQQGMRAVTARVAACYERFKVPGTVKVKVTIANTGVITEATATGSFANTDTGACVAKAVSQANFPEFSGPSMSLTYPFLLQ